MYHCQMLPLLADRLAKALQNMTKPGRQILRGPTRSINRPTNGAHVIENPERINKPDEICARDQSNSLCKGNMKTPME